MQTDTSSLIRAFIALDIPDVVKNELALVVAILRKTGADVKWVDTKNLHLTLKFLGEITREQVQEIHEALTRIVGQQRPFLIHLSGIGGFPSMERARVLWVGVDEGDEIVENLVWEIEEAVSSIGCEKEAKPFSSHLTIGRVKNFRHWETLIDTAKRISFSSASRIEVSHMNLYQSILSPHGPTHHLIHKTSFGG